MTARVYRLCVILLTVGLGISIGYAVITGNLFVPVFALIIAMGLKFILKRNLKEVVADERSKQINEKAAATTYHISVIIAAIISLVILVFRNQLSADAVVSGNILAYTACIMLIIHLAFYLYYSRKL